MLSSNSPLAGVLWLGLALGAIGPGCARDGDELLIVTPWPEAERELLETAFRRWSEANPDAATGPVRIHWIPLSPGDDPTRVVRRRVTPDLVLGVHATVFRRLAGDRWLLPIERTAHPLWCVIRRTPVQQRNTRGNDGGPPSSRPVMVTFDDFRRDPVALAWAQAVLAAGSWSEGYARLVRSAGHPRRIGRQAGASLAAVERGEVEMTPGVAKWIEWIEGVGVVRGGRNPRLAQEFVRFLADNGQAETPPADDPGNDPEVAALLADLLGATLVDAQDELWAAWARLEAAGHPERAERWMTEAPPWPPASIARMMEGGENGGTLLETMIAQVAPEADVRAWLLRSWLAPPRLVDGALLAELAHAVDGRLMREPRFRAWLRAEWTAWARQRYRRVARLSGAAVP